MIDRNQYFNRNENQTGAENIPEPKQEQEQETGPRYGTKNGHKIYVQSRAVPSTNSFKFLIKIRIQSILNRFLFQKQMTARFPYQTFKKVKKLIAKIKNENVQHHYWIIIVIIKNNHCLQ